ncbi:GbsR/MarR family transcriptional regulator [Kitasatospora paracochleata]|uniref:Transcriptional regulator n=1 Tax=Kitasatospora paracochleata TaxID=58354 RepID=A0ABT1ISL2_9ACTN|nr:MarR family transcriptional regulator [Kitasatospora paracochleata]MCP2308097.1 putative transcriptional regulator [Kitasatospora paracochleata]
MGGGPVERDETAVGAFIERFAGVLADAGFPRMPARIFSALLVTDSGRLTAAELADLLRVSPAAVSGAVRYLTQVNLVSREREAGSRRDRYRVHENAWYEASVSRDQALVRWETSLQEGIDAVGVGTPAGARLAESLAFFAFMREELPALLGRWRARRAEVLGSG